MDSAQLMQLIESQFPDVSERERKLFSSFSAEDQEHLYTTAYALYRNGKYREAKQFFSLLTLLNALNRKFWMGLGASQQMLKEYRTALASYGVAAVQNPDDPAVHEYAAECFYALQELSQAIKTLQSAILTAQKKRDKSLVERLEIMKKGWENMQQQKRQSAAKLEALK